jgi:hypothetical protein
MPHYRYITNLGNKISDTLSNLIGLQMCIHSNFKQILYEQPHFLSFHSCNGLIMLDIVLVIGTGYEQIQLFQKILIQ